MDVSLKGRRRVTSPGSPSGQAISLLLGDDSGLRSSVSLPYNAQYVPAPQHTTPPPPFRGLPSHVFTSSTGARTST